jgi:teichuronic acid biosynthesis glycosyltransferase TuaG
MMAEAGVTIAIPNWNHEILLPRAISSAMRAVALLRDRGVPAEVIVIDDCSRDGSLTLLRQLEALYHKDGLRLVAFGVNGGLAANRNYALVNARYRYIAFLDADNELIPENLPFLIDTLDRTKAAAAYGNLLVRYTAAEYAHNLLSNESIQDRLFDGNYIDAFAVFDRLQVLDVGGYDESYQALALAGWEDHELWLHLATNGRRVIFVPVVLGYYYVLPGSMAQDSVKFRAAQERIKRKYAQVNVRKYLPLNTNLLRYHPELGAL